MHSVDYGQPMARIERAWREARAKAGLPNFRMHDLRHTRITRAMADPDISAATVLALYGHSTIEQSLNYTQMRDPEKLDAVQKMAEKEAVSQKNGTPEAQSDIDPRLLH